MNIYLSTETTFTNNGLGFLTDCLSAVITDEINGNYSLTLEYMLNGHLSEYLVHENIIKCPVQDGTSQLFRIKYVNKDFNKITISAKHIFYDLLDNFLLDVAPTNRAAQSFGEWILARTNYESPFSFVSSIATTKSARYVRKNPVEAIMGTESNSMVNLFGGELQRDNFTINLLTRLGQDRGLKLIVGKNITGIQMTIDENEVYTRILPLGFDGLMLPETYVDSPLINQYPTPKVRKYEFSEIKYDASGEDESAYSDIQDAYQALRDAVNELYANGIDKPQINIAIDWIELSKTKEYEQFQNLETIRLGDTLKANLLGLDYETRVIGITYNVLANRVDSFTIGEVKPNIATTLNNIEKAVESVDTSSILDAARESATDLINNALVSNIYLDYATGNLYIMDTDNPQTATKLWRWNLNGLGYSDEGINGTYDVAMTMDGSIVANMITTGELNAELIQGWDSLTLQVDGLLEEKELTDEQIEEIKANYATLNDLENIQTQVNEVIGDTYTKTEINKIINGTDENGLAVSVLKTTSATFDENGMTYSKSGAATTSTINQEGLIVNDASSGTELLKAGYDSAMGETMVKAANLYLTKYLGIEDWRIEEVESTTYGQGVGFFYLGGGN